MAGVNDQTQLGGAAKMAAIGAYQLIDRLGAGGMGEVYKARTTDGKLVALKLVRRAMLAATPDLEGRFHREAMVSANIDHPAVVKVHDVGECPQGLYMVMDYAEGVGLDKRIKASPLPVAQALDIAAQICEALEVAHGMYVVHRDIKPGNVILEANGRVRLLDFGIARLGANAQNLTRTGQIVGTPAYMAPEQLHGDSKDADFRVDIYAVGVVLYEMLAGAQPFAGDNVFQLIDAITSSEPPPPSRRRAGIPPEVDRIVRKAMSRNPDRRHDNAGLLATDLRELVGALENGGRRGSTEPVRAGADRRRAASTDGALRPNRAEAEPPRGARRADSRIQSRPRLAGRKRRVAGVPMPWLLAGASLVALVAMVALFGSGGPAPTEDVVAPGPVARRDPPAKPTPTPPTPTPEPTGDTIAADLDRLERETDHVPAALVRRVKAWRDLETRGARSTHVERIATGLVAAEQRLEGAARAEFDRIKIKADELVESQSFDAAVEAWSGFDPVLSNDAWRERIEDERRAVEAARRKPVPPTEPPAEPPTDPPTQPDPPTPAQPPEPNAPGTSPVTAADGPMLPEAWTKVAPPGGMFGFHEKGGQWLQRDGELSLLAPAGGGAPALGCLVHRVSPTEVRRLREFYLVYDLMLIRGTMEVRVLAPVDQPGPPVKLCGLRLQPSDSDWLKLNRWHRMHISFRDGVMRYKVEGARPGDAEFNKMSNVESRQGAVVFGASPDSELRIRIVSLHVGTLGDRIGNVR